ncbi:MAG: cytosine deaminase [Synechococcales cyanobacterium K44_A2020_017]|nr:cytosine deaminase [Synechococcales cyanobacterium K32_A2020_035]MBF2094408.1 cytosine deaminase [Synechococcales cyanobacterium K44_A2020_017]
MIPETPSYWLRNARVPQALLSDPDQAIAPVIPHLAAAPIWEDLVALDVHIQDGQIAHLRPSGGKIEEPSVDLQQGLIFPGFVDIHTHLDKSHTWARTPNPDGTFMGALTHIEADKRHWTEADLYQRMDFGVRCAYAQGTVAIRTHLDIFENTIAASLSAFRQLKADWSDRVTLEAVALVTLDDYTTSRGEQLADAMAEVGGMIGGVPMMNADLDTQLDRVFTLAKDRQMPLDFHTDETNDPTSTTLRQVAIAALRHEFPHPILCGHCCNLSVQSEDEASKTMRLVQEAGISIVSLPMCNLFLQDRQPQRMPRWRGVTLLHELQAQGIPVAIANDNSRDAFFGYGNHDGLEALTQSVRIAQLDRPIGTWPRAITRTPAQIMGIAAGEIGVGRVADLILFSARNFSELFSRPQSDRRVLRQGKAIATTLPDYQELDHLVPY